MGEAWKARDTRLDRIVAIKTSKTEFSEPAVSGDLSFLVGQVVFTCPLARDGRSSSRDGGKAAVAFVADEVAKLIKRTVRIVVALG